MLYAVGRIDASSPRVMQRSYTPRSENSLNGCAVTASGKSRKYVLYASFERRSPSAVIGGNRPSGGSTMSDAWRDGLPRSPQCEGGPVPVPRGARWVLTVVSDS